MGGIFIKYICSGDDRRGSVSLQNIDLTPETVEEILEHKPVKEQQETIYQQLKLLHAKN